MRKNLDKIFEKKQKIFVLLSVFASLWQKQNFTKILTPHAIKQEIFRSTFEIQKFY